MSCLLHTARGKSCDRQTAIPSPSAQHLQLWEVAREPGHPTKVWLWERYGPSVLSKIHQYTGWMVMSLHTTEGPIQTATFIVPVPHSSPLRSPQKCKIPINISHLSVYLHYQFLLYIIWLSEFTCQSSLASL